MHLGLKNLPVRKKGFTNALGGGKMILRQKRGGGVLKIRVEICEDGDEEIIIRAKSYDDRIGQIENAIEGIAKARRTLALYIGNSEFFVPVADILYFETYDGKVFAHTKDNAFVAQYKLFELENILPTTFIRASKSSIVNVMRISSLSRELVGNGEITFSGSDKKIYFSRAFYKALRDRINEIRFS